MKKEPKNNEAVSWDYVTDVLIVGTGFTGLSAAIEAGERGTEVLVVEKMKSHGGNSIISDGGIAAPETSLQKKHGIIDFVEWMYEDMLKAGMGLNNPVLLRNVVEQANEAFEWTKNKLNVSYMDRVDIFGGHRVARCYTPIGITGAVIIKKMIEHINKTDINIKYSVLLHSLVTDSQGYVVGAELLEDYDYKSKIGTKRTVQVKKGIVLAAGGYGADIAFRSIQDPRLNAYIKTTNKPFATAEALKAALNIGAAPVQLSQIQLGAWASPDEEGFGDGPRFADYILFQYGIIVDPATGRRFINELSDRKKMSDSILNIGHPCVGIADEEAVKLSGWDISKAVKKGVVKCFNEIDEISECYGIDIQSLKESLERYNGYVNAKVDQEFFKDIPDKAQPIKSPPYYCMRLWPKVHYTSGGIAVNEKAQVLNFEGDIIKGLYAAGEIVGGVHGASRLGSCSVTECIVFGRIAGREVSAEIRKADLDV